MARLDNSPTPEPVRFLITPAGTVRLEQFPDGRVLISFPGPLSDEQRGPLLRAVTGLGGTHRIEGHGEAFLLHPLPASG